MNLSLFCGGGSGCYGSYQAGRRIHLAVDVDDKALEVVRHMDWADDTLSQDLSLVPESVEIIRRKLGPDIDHVIASPPCQDFSTSTNASSIRNSRPRASLTVSTAKILSELRPGSFTIENVTPMYNSEEYETLKSILSTYYDIMELIIDPSLLVRGCPTSRRRAYVIGTIISGSYDDAMDRFKEEDVSFRSRCSHVPLSVKEYIDSPDYVWFPPRNRTNAGVISSARPYPTIRTNAFVGMSSGYTTRPNDDAPKDSCRNLTEHQLCMIQGYPSNFSFPSGLSKTKRSRILGESQCPPAQREATRIATLCSTQQRVDRLGALHRPGALYRTNQNNNRSPCGLSHIDSLIIHHPGDGVNLRGGYVRTMEFDMDIVSEETKKSVSEQCKWPPLESTNGWVISYKERAIRNSCLDDVTFFHKSSKTRCRSHKDRFRLIELIR